MKSSVVVLNEVVLNEVVLNEVVLNEVVLNKDQIMAGHKYQIDYLS